MWMPTNQRVPKAPICYKKNKNARVWKNAKFILLFSMSSTSATPISLDHIRK